MNEQAIPAQWVPRDTLANRLVLVRAERNLTQQEAADKCGLTRSSWRVWEAGGMPRHLPAVIGLIAERLGVDRQWLLSGGPLWDPDGEPPHALAFVVDGSRTAPRLTAKPPLTRLRVAA